MHLHSFLIIYRGANNVQLLIELLKYTFRLQKRNVEAWIWTGLAVWAGSEAQQTALDISKQLKIK